MNYAHRKTQSPNHYLPIFSHLNSHPPSGEEFNESDLFDTSGSVPVSASPPSPANSHQFNQSPGILAALPESDTHSVFNHKASVSPASSTSSTTSFRPIPKRPPLDRQNSTRIQSAPVNVPTLTEAMKRIIAIREFENTDVVIDKEEEKQPPHVIVDAQNSLSPALASSVLEGVGRTLKGRDLRQVRNAVFRKTGFID